MTQLTTLDKLVIGECLGLVARGAIVPLDQEFDTVIGMSPDAFAALHRDWPGVDIAVDANRVAINNALNAVLGYPHPHQVGWQDRLVASRADVVVALERLRADASPAAPALELRIVRSHDSNDHTLPGLDVVFHEAWPEPHQPQLHWSTLGWHFVHLDGVGEAQRVVAHVGLLIKRVFVGGVPVRVGGIGGVATLTAYRGRGSAYALMRAAEAMMREHALEFGLLQCADRRQAMYGRLGWRPAGVAMRFDQPDGTHGYTIDRPMYLPLSTRVWPAGEIDMNGPPW
jgi:GNAT superfamily N-acetyltransferase